MKFSKWLVVDLSRAKVLGSIVDLGVWHEAFHNIENKVSMAYGGFIAAIEEELKNEIINISV